MDKTFNAETTTYHKVVDFSDANNDNYFEDNLGNVACKEIDRPTNFHFLWKVLPIIDDHNRTR